MKKYIRSSKRLNWQYVDSYRRYGWKDSELLKLEKFAEKLGADIEHVGNGYIEISWHGETLGRFAIFNHHKYIWYNDGGYFKTIDEVIQRLTRNLTKDSQYSQLLKDANIEVPTNPNVDIVNALKDGDIIELYAPLSEFVDQPGKLPGWKDWDDWTPYKVKDGQIRALDERAGWISLSVKDLVYDSYIGKVRLPK